MNRFYFIIYYTLFMFLCLKNVFMYFEAVHFIKIFIHIDVDKIKSFFVVVLNYKDSLKKIFFIIISMCKQ